MKDGIIETVGELIEKLQQCNPTDKIKVANEFGLFVVNSGNETIVEIVKMGGS